MNQSNRLYLFLALTILIWGNSFIVVEMAIEDGATPTLIAMARFVIASSIFGGYLLIRRPKGIDRVDLRIFLFLAFIGIGIYYVFQYYGVQFAGPAISSILVTFLCPIMIFLISYLRLGEHVSPLQTTGLGVAAVGAVLVITNGSVAFISSWEQLVGGAFGVTCAALWAIYTVEGKKVVKRYDPFIATAYLSLLGTAMLLPFALTEASVAEEIAFPPTFFLAAIYLGVLCTVVGYVLWFRALTGLTASSTGATLYFEPIVTVIFAWLVLGQAIGWITAVGGGLVMLGVLLVSRG